MTQALLSYQSSSTRSVTQLSSVQPQQLPHTSEATKDGSFHDAGVSSCNWYSLHCSILGSSSARDTAAWMCPCVWKYHVMLSLLLMQDKVRDIKYDQQQQQVAAVCVDSTISWWSSELLLRGSCLLPEQYEEPVVVQPHGSLLIVGCEQQALLIDTRAGQRLVAAVAASTGNSSKRSRINSHAAAAAEHSEPAAIVSSTESGQQMVRKGLQAVLQHNQPGGQAFLQQAEQQHMSGYVAMAPHSNAVHGQAVGQEAPASLLGNVHQQPLQQWAHDLDSQNDSASEEDFDSDEVEDVVITGVGGNEQLRPIQQYLQEQLQQPHHPPDPHHAYEWAWQTTAQHYSMQRRVLTSGHQQQGLKRLLHHDLEAAASPDGIKTDHAWVDAAVTGDIAVGRGRVSWVVGLNAGRPGGHDDHAQGMLGKLMSKTAAWLLFVCC